MPSPQPIEYNNLPEKNNQFVIFKTEDDKISVDVRFESETAWLTQAHLVELFQSSKANISEHIKFGEGELNESSVVRKFRTTASDGKTYEIAHYNLDMIISLGYRINSKIAKNYLNEKELKGNRKGTYGLQKICPKNLSPIEQEYLNNIKILSEKGKKGIVKK
ncbi:hypothetical protein FACS189440_15840 [Bacteroidia bacterium]|nr:hypothetical protein FACS189423_01270 [Bacteroidia bacterium]GHT49691.1 hypothetical protein FACS189440_15840 [Bacteroidia bacterium]